MNNNLPTPDDLQKSWEDLGNIYAQHLEQHRVKIPKVRKYNEQAKSIWLAVLHYYKGVEVHKDDISKVCQRDKPSLKGDQQVRHLKRNGWHLTSDGKGNHLLDPYKPSPEWETDRIRREGRLTAKTFEDIKVTYENVVPLVERKKENLATDTVKTKSSYNKDTKTRQNPLQI